MGQVQRPNPWSCIFCHLRGYAKAIIKVKASCVFVVDNLIYELGNQFPSHELMDVIGMVGMVYP
jgi:hypothetical protein